MNAIILHGTGSSPRDYWFPYLETKLEKLGYEVWVPALPDPNNPSLDSWLPFILASGTLTRDTVLIGHSAGAQIILSILENIDEKVKKVILVSGYAGAMKKNDTEKTPKKLDWERIKTHSQEFIVINSDNDPWGWDDKQGKLLHEHLGGKLIIRHDGHMGSTTYNQPYNEFPLLVDIIK